MFPNAREKRIQTLIVFRTKLVRVAPSAGGWRREFCLSGLDDVSLEVLEPAGYRATFGVHGPGVTLLFDPKKLDAFIRRATDALPPDATVLREDVATNLRSLLESALSRMNLVTREEFDVQQAVLRRTREKLERLEVRIAELEAAGSAAADAENSS